MHWMRRWVWGIIHRLYRHQFAVKLGSVAVTLTFQGLIQKIEWHWTQEVSDQLSLAPPVIPFLTNAFQGYFSSGTPLGQIPWDLIDDSGWTPFQKQVYRAIEHIPHGETRTYGWVASRIGNGAAGRAVGQALRSNPLPILIPCHRVVASTSLGGFMGLVDPNCSELRLKQRLIAVEEEYINPLFNFLTPSRELFPPIAPPSREEEPALLLEALA
jgi:O-6-methylguanine DNA methyltransferase